MAAKMAQATGPTLRHAGWREVRAFQVKTIAGKSRHRAVSLKLRRLPGGAGVAEADAIEVTVVMVATAVWAAPARVTLDGRSEQ
jgi:hypothetical protein